MRSGDAWSAGPLDKTEGRAALLRLVGTAEAVRLICRWCGADEFEAVGRELFCFGCCLPMGVPDGGDDGFPGQFPWNLEPSHAPLPAHTPDSCEFGAIRRCPVGHRVFEVALVFVPTEDRRIHRLTIGLRCPDEGWLHLYIDNARVLPAESRTHGCDLSVSCQCGVCTNTTT
ncbi:hypothetical protein ACFXEL_24640 [Streptomyces sp. NPDC059382]|uniref:hypothetical protein n=1 Tax=Streptomyces sp. NPDC059382 TaxID=3346816 RepID=UPI003693ED02